jgi:hypothetical protein
MAAGTFGRALPPQEAAVSAPFGTPEPIKKNLRGWASVAADRPSAWPLSIGIRLQASAF